MTVLACLFVRIPQDFLCVVKHSILRLCVEPLAFELVDNGEAWVRTLISSPEPQHREEHDAGAEDGWEAELRLIAGTEQHGFQGHGDGSGKVPEQSKGMQPRKPEDGRRRK